MKRRVQKITGYLGPRGCVLLIAGVLSIGVGIGTINSLDGRPHDAPHIRLASGEVRGSVWIIAGIVAVIASSRRDWGWWGVPLLWVMPGIRVVSYAIAWIASWVWVDPHVPDSDVPGDPGGYYALCMNCFALLAAACATWADMAWATYDRPKGRGDDAQ